MFVQVLRVAALAVVAVLVGVAGAFVHRWAVPLGLALALSAVVGLVLICRSWASSRIGIGVAGLSWLAAVLVLAAPHPEGDVVIAGDTPGLVYLFGGVLCVGVAIGLGAGTGRVRAFE